MEGTENKICKKKESKNQQTCNHTKIMHMKTAL